MQDTPVENSKTADVQIWHQYRHLLDHRAHLFRFSLSFLGIFSLALTLLLLQGAGPWVCTSAGIVLCLVCVALAAQERQNISRLQRLEAMVLPVKNGKGGKGKSDGAADSGFDFMGKSAAWPAYGAYGAFAALGLLFAALPISGRTLTAKPLVQVTLNTPEQKLPAAPVWQKPPMTPFGIPVNLPHRTPSALDNPRPFIAMTPFPNTQIPRFPLHTPAAQPPPVQTAPGSVPAGAAATPPPAFSPSSPHP